MHNNCTKCGSNKSCGCGSGPLTTAKGCPCPPDPNCMVPNKCAEFVDSQCVYYNDASIMDIGIEEGSSLEQVLQQLAILLTNPSCATPGSSCQSTLHVYPYLIGSTSIALAWAASPTSVNYQVEYKNITDVLWTLMPVQAPNSPLTAVISPLLPGTTYLIRVNSFCGVGNCYSVTLKINTKP